MKVNIIIILKVNLVRFEGVYHK